MLNQLDGISEILNHPQCYRYLHIPVQSGNDDVLYSMNREYTVNEFNQVVDVLSQNVDDLQFATDIIVGFPGENNEQFVDSLNLVKKYQFRNVNIAQF